MFLFFYESNLLKHIFLLHTLERQKFSCDTLSIPYLIVTFYMNAHQTFLLAILRYCDIVIKRHCDTDIFLQHNFIDQPRKALIKTLFTLYCDLIRAYLGLLTSMAQNIFLSQYFLIKILSVKMSRVYKPLPWHLLREDILLILPPRDSCFHTFRSEDRGHRP